MLMHLHSDNSDIEGLKITIHLQYVLKLKLNMLVFNNHADPVGGYLDLFVLN